MTDGDGAPGTGGGDRRMHTDGTRYDLDFKDSDFWEEMGRRLDYDLQIGSEYITYQVRTMLPLVRCSCSCSSCHSCHSCRSY